MTDLNVGQIISNTNCKGVFKGGGVQGFNPPPRNFQIFLKSEGKEIERKRKKGCWGEGLRNFRGGLRNFGGGVEKFSGGGGVKNFFGGGLEIFGGGG